MITVWAYYWTVINYTVTKENTQARKLLYIMYSIPSSNYDDHVLMMCLCAQDVLNENIHLTTQGGQGKSNLDKSPQTNTCSAKEMS